MSDHGRPITCLHARVLYDGVSDQSLHDQLIEFSGGRITAVRALGAGDTPPKGCQTAEIVAPGFIDMQINGAADVQFNETPTIETVASMAAGARQGGTAHILPTFITAPNDDYRHAIEATNQALAERVPGILGVHLEGPFLSPDRPGIHPPRYIRAMTKNDVAAIGKSRGTTLVTLAPECQGTVLIETLAANGARVFVGHSNATVEQMDNAIKAGISGVTHLFNAMSQITGREPGVVGSALMRPELAAGMIADGHHVHAQNMAMAFQLMHDRLCLVTDAMKTLAGTTTVFDLYGVPITLEKGRLCGSDGTLAGAHLAMDEAVRNAIVLMGASTAQALQMASGNPARALGLADQLGRVVPGFRASLALLSKDFRATGVIVDGMAFP